MKTQSHCPICNIVFVNNYYAHNKYYHLSCDRYLNHQIVIKVSNDIIETMSYRSDMAFKNNTKIIFTESTAVICCSGKENIRININPFELKDVAIVVNKIKRSLIFS